jgi:uncharacterized protein (DUF1684 family)
MRTNSAVSGLAALLLVGAFGCDGAGAPQSTDRDDGAPAPSLAPAGEARNVDEFQWPSLEEWKRRRDEALRRDDGWLTLVGLHWLEEGSWSLGSAPGSDLRTDEGAPPIVGRVRLDGETVVFEAHPGVEVLLAGDPIEAISMAADVTGDPTVLSVGKLRFHLIERDGRFALRVKDSAHPALATFAGMEYFDEDPAWRIEARWIAYEPPRQIEVPNILGTVAVQPVLGALEFEVDGETFRLEPTGESLDELFLVFGDLTNRDGRTYGGGRFLVVPPPRDGKVVVDFNRAYNPPCVFTPYATCPLPPERNKLPIAIPAGEKMYADH